MKNHSVLSMGATRRANPHRRWPALVALPIALLLATPAAAQSVVCEYVDTVTAKVGASVSAVAGLAVSNAPVAVVLHSSGAKILTGAGGYFANTLGWPAVAWAALTSPFTLAAGGAAIVGVGATVAYCRWQHPGAEPGAIDPGRAKPFGAPK